MSGVRASENAASSIASGQNPCVFLFAALVFVLASFLGPAGCRKKGPAPLTPARIHSITKELEDAAHAAAPAGTPIHVALQASEKNPDAADRLDITLLKSSSSSTRASVAKIHQALGAVATRQGLTEEPAESREGILLFYLKSGVRTHAVHIHTGANAPEQSGNSSFEQNAPELAVILDDLGSDRSAAQAIFELPYPLTISVLPNHEHSNEIASQALSRGYQVLLHLPMQAVGEEKPEAQELRPGMPAVEVTRLVDQFLQSVPGAVGVNNHQGSQATSDAALMRELMPVLRDRHLFYIDSRTTAATVAYDMAQISGEPSAFRNVPFLDDVAEVGAVRKQLDLAFRGAREKRQAVAIGHPHPATLEALREFLPKAQEQGVRLVFASDLVH